MHEQSARGVHNLKSTNKGPRTKVHGRSKFRWAGKEILGIYLKMHFFFEIRRELAVVLSGTFSGRLSETCCSACSSGTFVGL